MSAGPEKVIFWSSNRRRAQIVTNSLSECAKFCDKQGQMMGFSGHNLPFRFPGSCYGLRLKINNILDASVLSSKVFSEVVIHWSILFSSFHPVIVLFSSRRNDIFVGSLDAHYDLFLTRLFTTP